MKTLVPVAATVIAAALPLSAAEINGKVTLKGTPPPAAVIAAVKADANCGKVAVGEAKSRVYVVGANGALHDHKVLHGQVRRIGSDALPPDQLKDFYRFPVDIKLNQQQMRLKSGQPLDLQVGMSLTANIKLRKVTYLQLLLSTFKEKADSLRSI
jgi:hypothetical protein